MRRLIDPSTIGLKFRYLYIGYFDCLDDHDEFYKARFMIFSDVDANPNDYETEGFSALLPNIEYCRWPVGLYVDQSSKKIPGAVYVDDVNGVWLQDINGDISVEIAGYESGTINKIDLVNGQVSYFDW